MNILYILISGIIILTLSYFGAASLRNLKATQFGNIITIPKNNRVYSVQDLPNKDEAVELIYKVDNWVLSLLKSLQQQNNSMAVQRLVANYNSDSIIEGDPLNADNFTSYSINKGQNLVICLRSRKNLELHNFTLICFVVAHELAHLASASVGHNKEFYTNFKMILSHAIKNNLFDENYFDNNVNAEYCGMAMGSNPVKNVLKHN